MSQVQQVKDATDIVELIGERIDLKNSGRNWRGLCPFHGEHTPSFFVNQELQRYKCFGCGESGDALTFLEKYEGMTFGEALQYLAERAGITLESYQPTTADTERDQLLSVLDLAKEYFHYLLTEHEAGEPAREYLKQRGINHETIKIFQLGYSLSSWEGLTTYLTKKKKFSVELLEKAGLVIRNQQRRYYDRFRGRIMFPLKNHRGQVVGFSGRVLDPKAKEAKYINSPETQLYHKADLLYGYSELLQFIRKANEVIVVEGEFDVISSSQAHVDNIVAIKGSAFTQQHAKLIKRVAEKVLFALDMDSAGVTATKRAILIAQQEGLELRVISLPNTDDGQAKDPDELARHQPKLWRETAKHSLSVYQFLINAALVAHNPKTPEGKRAIVNELAPVLNQITHEVEKDFYYKELAAKLDVKIDLIKKDVDRISSGKKRPIIKTKEKTQLRPLTRREKLERYLWFLWLNEPDAEVRVGRKPRLLEINFADPKLSVLAAALGKFTTTWSLDTFSQTLPEDMQAFLFDLQMPSATISENLNYEEEWTKALQDFKQQTLQEQLAEITRQLDELDQGDVNSEAKEKRQQELLQEIVSLRSKLK